jgi:hypothetical protein
VIATRWSGQLEFLNDNNSYLIDIEGLSPIDQMMKDMTEAEDDHLWAEPSVDRLKFLMRHVFENYGEAKKKAKKGRKDIVSNFTWKHSALKILERITENGGLQND